MEIKPVGEMSSLARRLGKSGVERINYTSNRDSSKEPNSANIENTVLYEMGAKRPNTLGCRVGEWIEIGATYNINESRPLNINRLYTILQCMPIINTREVVKLSGLSPRQSQKYVRAIRFIMPYLEDILLEDELEEEDFDGYLQEDWQGDS